MGEAWCSEMVWMCNDDYEEDMIERCQGQTTCETDQ